MNIHIIENNPQKTGSGDINKSQILH